ncbi:hypothetical protein HanRHA438_Chr16g0742341 [Helianthus annuus]|nr:hypothetical protein HanRHA438_Chr16g0742341 [Helianthus annuus]
MPDHGETTIGFFEVFDAGVTVDFEDVVVIDPHRWWFVSGREKKGDFGVLLKKKKTGWCLSIQGGGVVVV